MSVAASMAEEAAARALGTGLEELIPASRDAYARARRAAAIAAALLLHASLIAVLLLAPQKEEPPPPLIVELVAAPPPMPAAQSAAPLAAPSPPAAPAADDDVRASGGELERANGEPPKSPAPEAEVRTPEATQAKDKAQAAAPLAPASASKRPAPEAAPSAATAALPLPPEAKPSPEPEPTGAREATAPPHPPLSPKVETASLGKGGGDRYLNELRDEIKRNYFYPPAARSQHLSGTAQYDLLLDRQGRLMHVRLLHSSGADILDEAGREMIERSAPFPPPPPDFIGEIVDLTVTLPLP